MSTAVKAPMGDKVYTPDWCAKDIVDWFKPTGRVLDPCRGMGAFSKHLPPHDWCEIDEGRDFFGWTDHVDWIIGNPPYTGFRDWFAHGFEVADNVVWLVPVWKGFSAYGLQKQLRAWGGGLAHIRHYGTGNKLGWPLGNAIGALHYQKGYTGPIHQSDYNVERETL